MNNNSDNRKGDVGSEAIILFFLLIGLIFTLIASLSAILATVLFMLLLKVIREPVSSVSTETVFKATFWASIGYLIMGIIASYLLLILFPGKYPEWQQFSLKIAIDFFRIQNWNNAIILRLLFHLPCILISAIILEKRFKDDFLAIEGFKKAFLTSAVIIFPSVLFAVWLFVLLGAEIFPSWF